MFLPLFQAFAQEPYEHAESRYRFPVSIGEFTRGKVTQFPDKRLGVAVGYSAPGLGTVNLYLFDYGLSAIPDGPDSDVVRKAFLSSERDVRELLKRGDYSDLTVTSAPGATLEVHPRAPRFNLTTYEYQVNRGGAEPVVSWLLVTGARNHFFKVRYTCPASRSREGQGGLEGLLSAFFEANGP
jgi:hypothetical protein